MPQDGRASPTGIPGGVQPIRVTVNTYYSDTPDALSPVDTDPDIYFNGGAPALRNAIKSTEVGNSSGQAATRVEYVYDNPLEGGNLTEQKVMAFEQRIVQRPANEHEFNLRLTCIRPVWEPDAAHRCARDPN